MNPVLPTEAIEFAATAAKSFAALGGVDAARRAEEEPARREGEVTAALAAIGAEDLDPRANPDSLAAAAALCETAGTVALPFPLVGTLLRDRQQRPFAVVPEGIWRVDHGDLFPQWRVASLTGGDTIAAANAAPLGSRLGPFVTDLHALDRPTGDPRHLDATPHPDLAIHLTLTAWHILGTTGRALELAVEHVQGRVQFGKPIAAFQSVQFQLADCSVAVAGLRELACFTLWRLTAAPDDALTDALALRLHAIDVARTVLRTTQQLHGAAGVCDEYDICVLIRLVQPALRLPWGAERTTAALAEAIARHGFEGLFPQGTAPR
ncbi:MAG: acyl-CoA dehydrogenase [Acidimicrobiia bacterium]|nr:acyl-CoA dehydrogenase [Acidimicrobiia bacterium]